VRLRCRRTWGSSKSPTNGAAPVPRTGTPTADFRHGCQSGPWRRSPVFRPSVKSALLLSSHFYLRLIPTANRQTHLGPPIPSIGGRPYDRNRLWKPGGAPGRPQLLETRPQRRYVFAFAYSARPMSHRGKPPHRAKPLSPTHVVRRSDRPRAAAPYGRANAHPLPLVGLLGRGFRGWGEATSWRRASSELALAGAVANADLPALPYSGKRAALPHCWFTKPHDGARC